MSKKTCVICGAEGYSYYPYCYKHLQEKKDGKIIKCEDCGKWNAAEETCECQKQKKKEKEPTHINAQKKHIDDKNIEVSINIDAEKPLTQCVLCKKDANGHLFCKECYYKYKDKTLLLKIEKCAEITILDESYEGIYKCPDGHIVKSKAEREIDNYLYREKRCRHVYEKAVSIDGNQKNDLHPDFYLPDENLYIEYWGFDETNTKYTETKKYRMEKYKELCEKNKDKNKNEDFTLICMYEKTDAKDIEAALSRKLNNYTRGKINFEE